MIMLRKEKFGIIGKQLKILVKEEEERLLAIRKAEESARQSTEQAERAKRELEDLKEQKK